MPDSAKFQINVETVATGTGAQTTKTDLAEIEAISKRQAATVAEITGAKTAEVAVDKKLNELEISRGAIVSMQLEANQLRAAGRTIEADVLEREVALEMRAVQLQKTLNIEREEAVALARADLAAQEKIAAVMAAQAIEQAEQGEKSKIHGRAGPLGHLMENFGVGRDLAITAAIGGMFGMEAKRMIEEYTAKVDEGAEAMEKMVHAYGEQRHHAETLLALADSREAKDVAEKQIRGEINKLLLEANHALETGNQKEWEQAHEQAAQLDGLLKHADQIREQKDRILTDDEKSAEALKKQEESSKRLSDQVAQLAKDAARLGEELKHIQDLDKRQADWEFKHMAPGDQADQMQSQKKALEKQRDSLNQNAPGGEAHYKQLTLDIEELEDKIRDARNAQAVRHKRILDDESHRDEQRKREVDDGWKDTLRGPESAGATNAAVSEARAGLGVIPKTDVGGATRQKIESLTAALQAHGNNAAELEAIATAMLNYAHTSNAITAENKKSLNAHAAKLKELEAAIKNSRPGGS